MDIKNLKLSVFKNLSSSDSKLYLMDSILQFIRYDKYVEAQTLTYRDKMRNLGEEEAAKKVKSKLIYAFSVAVTFDGKGKTAFNAVAFTGLAFCDIDHVEPGKMEEVRSKICADPHTFMLYTTVSGQGFRALYKYEREPGEDDRRPTATSWRAAFKKGNEYIANLAGWKYDEKCADYEHLSGMAFDPDCYYNPDSEPFVITDAEITAANFAAGTQPGKPRKDLPQGSCNESVEKAWPRVEQMLARNHLEYTTGHHHDYVMHAAFLFNRFGVDEDELISWADQNWSDYMEEHRHATIHSCYKKTDDHGTWKLNAPGRKRENAMITLPEIREWLSDRIELRYNQVTDQRVYRTKRKLEAGGYEYSPWQAVDERVLCSVRCQMALDTEKRVLKKDADDVMNSDFSHLMHPVRDYLKELPEWDGTDRVVELASHVHINEEAAVSILHLPSAILPLSDTFLWALHKWLVGMVATWQRDEATNEQVLTLIGPQGKYKTTFFRHLLPPALRDYFWENTDNSFKGKDNALALTENCLVDIEEIDVIKDDELARLKGLITSDVIKERRVYGKFREIKHRLASFCATGNQDRFLTDDSGNRRWLCFMIEKVDNPREWTLDYDQLYAQLLHELNDGFRYYFDNQEEERIGLLNKPFMVESFESELIRSKLRHPKRGEHGRLMSASEIALLICGGRITEISQRKVSRAMKNLEFKVEHKMNGNFYRVVVMDYNESQLYIEDDQPVEAPENQQDAIEQELPF